MTRRLGRPWMTVLVVLAACGLVIGWAGRVLTAGGIGANIGAGLIQLFLAPVLGVILVLAPARAVHLVAREA